MAGDDGQLDLEHEDVARVVRPDHAQPVEARDPAARPCDGAGDRPAVDPRRVDVAPVDAAEERAGYAIANMP